ncbi:MAG: DnaJ domain-containing protein [Rhizobiales bacterium]|nr:DnaJ domain-containing protein [Hyphomicrobiales bacterium]
MGLFLPLLGSFVVSAVLIYLYARPKGPGGLKVLFRRAAAGALIALGAGLTLSGRLFVGIPLVALALWLWRPPILEPNRISADGRIRLGRFTGRRLDDLSLPEIAALYAEIASNPRDRALLEAHLDRRVPGWRENFQRDAAGRTRGAARPGAMTDQQAYEILGLAPGASEAEIQAAYRRLMKRVHPDQGGSTFLAAQINEAKERLLGRHR